MTTSKETTTVIKEQRQGVKNNGQATTSEDKTTPVEEQQ